MFWQKLLLTLVIVGGVGGGTLQAWALTVSPARIEVTVDPGQVYRGEIDLFNEQDSDKTFFATYENFEPRGDSGAPYFIGAEDGLATWIETVDQVTLAPGQRLPVAYTITVPDEATPGGYFAAIFFGSQPPKSSGGGEVSIGGKVGILVLLRVAGEVAVSGGLEDFTGVDDQKVFSTLPVALEYRLSNSGGDRVVPLGDVVIKNTFGKTAATLLANANEGSVLPGSTRKFMVVWETAAALVETSDETQTGFFAKVAQQWRDFHIGWYTAKLNLSWGDTNETARAVQHFVIMPWQLLTLLGGLVLFLGVVGRIGLKKYNRYIIAQATRKR